MATVRCRPATASTRRTLDHPLEEASHFLGIRRLEQALARQVPLGHQRHVVRGLAEPRLAVLDLEPERARPSLVGQPDAARVDIAPAAVLLVDVAADDER